MNQFKEFEGLGISGLANLGNTCFINTTLQCLSHCYELNKFLKKGKYKQKLNKKAESLILLEWDKLRDMLWSENCIVSPGGFISSVQKVAKIKDKDIFTGFAQNDSSEFLGFIIDCFHTAIQREVNMTITGTAESDTDKLAEKCYGMMKNMYKKEYSEFLNMFYGIQVSKIVNEADEYMNAIPEPFLMLNLCLPEESQKNNKSCTLIDCFNHYTLVEVLDGDNKLYNEETKEKYVAKKQVLFWSLPDLLIITLKRFGNSTNKFKCLVDFPLENLNLSEYVVGYNKFSYNYDLYGICNHSGGVFGGHYTAFVKNANNKWYHFNDQLINEVTDISKLCSPQAYCLFYRKKK
jgi:ubiquitin carboxyl-terminal hydrolase 8